MEHSDSHIHSRAPGVHVMDSWIDEGFVLFRGSIVCVLFCSSSLSVIRTLCAINWYFVLCFSFLSFLQIKLTLNSKWIPSHWFVESWSSLWNPHNKTTTNVMALLWTLAQYHSLGRKLSGHWRTCQGLWCISSLLGCSIARIIPASWLFISGDSSEQPVFCPVLTPNVSSVIRSRNRESILTFICKKPAVQCDTYWQFGQIFTSHCASRGGLLLL